MEEKTTTLNLSKYDVSQATHKLQCRHQICRNGFDYSMLCIPLKKTSSRRLKIIVFGERYWRHRLHIKRIRYVPSYKVIPLSQGELGTLLETRR